MTGKGAAAYCPVCDEFWGEHKSNCPDDPRKKPKMDNWTFDFKAQTWTCGIYSIKALTNEDGRTYFIPFRDSKPVIEDVNLPKYTLQDAKRCASPEEEKR